jgi:hypothetical protein
MPKTTAQLIAESAELRERVKAARERSNAIQALTNRLHHKVSNKLCAIKLAYQLRQRLKNKAP